MSRGQRFESARGLSILPIHKPNARNEEDLHLIVEGRQLSRCSLSAAWAPKGKRACGRVPLNCGKNTTLIASLSLREMGQAMSFEDATDREVFKAYAERFLAPALRPGQR